MVNTLATLVAATRFGDIEYLDRGTGYPILVIHGSPGGCDQGSLMADFLVEAGFRAVIPSRPGYLGTALTPVNASIDAQADSHAALMDSIGVDRFAVLCWSGGGPSGYRVAARHPNRVSSLVALSAVSRADHWDDSITERIAFETRVGNWLLRQMARFAKKSFVSATLAAEGELTKEQLKSLTASVMADDHYREVVLGFAADASRLPPRRDGIRNDMRNFAAINDLQLSAITAPTLLIHGRRDRDVLPAYSEFAAEQISGARLEWVDPGTHLCAFVEPQSANVQARIVEFLRQNP